MGNKREIDLDRSVQAVTKHAPAANTAAVATISAATGKRPVLNWVLFSYDNIPTGGGLTIAYTKGGVATTIEIDVTAAGPYHIPFPDDSPIVGDIGTEIVVTVLAGGAGCSGKVNANSWYIP